jgi:hypothetical protein
MRALLSILAMALAVAPISGCAAPVASTNAAQGAAERVMLEGTRALVIGELAYRAAATTALAATRAGFIRGADAEKLRVINQAATAALIDAKSARDAGSRAAAAARLIDQVTALNALLQSKGFSS